MVSNGKVVAIGKGVAHQVKTFQVVYIINGKIVLI